LKRLELLIFNRVIRVPVINPSTGEPYEEFVAVVNACLSNETYKRTILINRRVPYPRYLINIIHEFGHVIVYILIEDILRMGREGRDKHFLHKYWDFIQSPYAFFSKTELYKAFYESDTWEKKK